MEQHNGTTYENVWGVKFGDRLEEAREEARAEGKAEGREEGKAEGREGGKAEGRKEGKAEGIQVGRKGNQIETIRRMIKLGFDDKTIQTAVGVADMNEIIAIRKTIKTE